MKLYPKSIRGTLMKIFLSVVLVFISLISLFAVVDDSAMNIYNESFNRAVYSFALAKGLNAIISVIQSSEINVGVIVGATVGIGQMLDPVNDLVERFSWIMLASSVSIGIQHLLLLLGKSTFIKTALLLSTLFTLMIIWIRKLSIPTAFIFAIKTTIFLIVLRFGAVVFIYGTEILYNQVYSEQYSNATSFMVEYKKDLEIIQKDNKKLETYWTKFEEKMEVFSKKVIKLITIFVVTTIISPLLFLWFFILMIKFIFNLKFDDDKITSILNKKEFK